MKTMSGNVQLNSKTKRRIKTGLFMAAMMGPAILGFLVFYVYVNFNSILMAFRYEDHGEYVYSFIYFESFFAQLTRPGADYSIALKNTLLFFGLGYVQMLLSLLVAYFVYKQIKGYKFFRFIYYLPAIIMATALALLFDFVTQVKGPIGVAYKGIYGEKMPTLWKH